MSGLRCKQIICREAALGAIAAETEIDRQDLMTDEQREAATECMDHFAHDIMKLLMSEDED